MKEIIHCGLLASCGLDRGRRLKKEAALAADSPRPMLIPGRVQTVRVPCPRPWTFFTPTADGIGQGREKFVHSADARPAVTSREYILYRKLRGHCAFNDVNDSTDAAPFVA